MYCPECGSEVEDGVRFCPDCGTAVDRQARDGTGSSDEGAVSPDASADSPVAPETEGGLRHGDGRGGPADEASEDGRRSREGYPETTPPLLGGAIAGAITYLVGYLVVYGLVLLERQLSTTPPTGVQATEIRETTVVGWLFYGAHNVPVVTSLGNPVNLVQHEVFTAVPRATFYVVPPATLLLAGLLLGRRVLARRREERGWVTPKDGAVVGATLTIGYVVLAGVGAFVFANGEGAGTVGPQLWASIGLLGVAYPLAFGTLGGALAGT